MTANELISYALTASCTIISHNHKFVFSCPTHTTFCSSCDMWDIPNLTSKCLFWDEELVSKSLELEAISILQSTHPELFL